MFSHQVPCFHGPPQQYRCWTRDWSTWFGLQRDDDLIPKEFVRKNNRNHFNSHKIWISIQIYIRQPLNPANMPTWIYLHDEDSVDVNMISFRLFHALNFSSRLLSQKQMDFYAAKSPILSAIQSSSGQVAIESVAWHSWPSFGRIISRNFTKPRANPTWGTVSFLNLHWVTHRPRLCTLEGSCAQLSCRICSNFRSKEFLRR